jgi:hypothetical protein
VTTETHPPLVIRLPQGGSSAERYVRSVAKATQMLCERYTHGRRGNVHGALKSLVDLAHGAARALQQEQLDGESQHDATHYGDPTS